MKGLLIFSTIFFCLQFPGNSQGRTSENCNYAIELFIDSSLEIFPTESSQLQQDTMGNMVFFYPENNKISSWFKLSVQANCTISFNIYPSGANDHYNFFMYKHPSKTNFCEDVAQKKIIPIRANLYKENIKKSGTGLSENTKEIAKDKGEELYRSAYHQPVLTNAGDIYYLNIYHISGNDCGYFLQLSAGKAVYGFRTVDKNCFYEPLKKIEREKPMEEIDKKIVSEISVGNFGKLAQKRKIEHVTVSGIVTDSITKKPLQAELKWKDEISGKEITAHTNLNGEYSMLLDEKIIYKLSCTTVGYKEKTVKFIRQNLNSEHLMQDFAMGALQPGDNFVLKHIYFYAGTYAMKTESQPELEKLLSYLSSNEKMKIEIQGHCNGEGKIKKKKNNKKKNEEGWDFHGNEKKLSKFRAEAIKNFLVKNGVSQERILTQGLGATKMIYPEPKNQKERDANKRVEVHILPASGELAQNN